MKKRSLILLSTLLVTLLFASISGVSAGPDNPGAIDCVLDITHDVYPDGKYWLGTVTGPDCSVAGTIRFDAVPEEYFNAGKTVHFVEEFTIEPYSGGIIRGKNYGVWNLSTFKYRANGWVLDASAEWVDLIGFKYHESGTTSNPADGLPITAPGGWAKLVPANGPPAP